MWFGASDFALSQVTADQPRQRSARQWLVARVQLTIVIA